MKIIRIPLAMLALASFTAAFASDPGSLPARQAESRATRQVESQVADCQEACRVATCATDHTKPAQAAPAEKNPES